MPGEGRASTVVLEHESSRSLEPYLKSLRLFLDSKAVLLNPPRDEPEAVGEEAEPVNILKGASVVAITPIHFQEQRYHQLLNRLLGEYGATGLLSISRASELKQLHPQNVGLVLLLEVSNLDGDLLRLELGKPSVLYGHILNWTASYARQVNGAVMGADIVVMDENPGSLLGAAMSLFGFQKLQAERLTLNVPKSGCPFYVLPRKVKETVNNPPSSN